MQNTEQMLLIPLSVVNAIGTYLAERPWKEVSEVMPILESLEKWVPNTQVEREESTNV